MTQGRSRGRSAPITLLSYERRNGSFLSPYDETSRREDDNGSFRSSTERGMFALASASGAAPKSERRALLPREDEKSACGLVTDDNGRFPRWKAGNREGEEEGGREGGRERVSWGRLSARRPARPYLRSRCDCPSRRGAHTLSSGAPPELSLSPRRDASRRRDAPTRLTPAAHPRSHSPCACSTTAATTTSFAVLGRCPRGGLARTKRTTAGPPDCSSVGNAHRGPPWLLNRSCEHVAPTRGTRVLPERLLRLAGKSLFPFNTRLRASRQAQLALVRSFEGQKFRHVRRKGVAKNYGVLVNASE